MAALTTPDPAAAVFPRGVLLCYAAYSENIRFPMEFIKKYCAHAIVTFIVLAMALMLMVNRLTATRQGAQERVSAPQPDIQAEVPLFGPDSSRTRSVTVTQIGGKTTMTIRTQPAEEGGFMAAGLRAGSCDKPGEERFPLSPVKDGVSITVFEMPYADIFGGEEGLIVEIREANTETVDTVACGPLPVLAD